MTRRRSYHSEELQTGRHPEVSRLAIEMKRRSRTPEMEPAVDRRKAVFLQSTSSGFSEMYRASANLLQDGPCRRVCRVGHHAKWQHIDAIFRLLTRILPSCVNQQAGRIRWLDATPSASTRRYKELESRMHWLGLCPDTNLKSLRLARSDTVPCW